MPAMTDINIDPVFDGSGVSSEVNKSDDIPWVTDMLPDISTSLPRTSPVSSTFLENDPTLPTLVYRDIEDSSARQGVSGLQNLGNTCFMNSGLQCLLSNHKLTKFFLEDFELDHMNTETLTGRFAYLLHKVWRGKFSCLYPSDFKDTLAMYHPQFKDYRQHDCQEFLALLLDSFHELLNKANNPSDCFAACGGESEVSIQSDSATSSTVIDDNQSDLQSDIVDAQYNQSDGVSDSSTLHSQSDSPIEGVLIGQEDSNLSEASVQSIDVHERERESHRVDHIPDVIKAFSCEQYVEERTEPRGTVTKSDVRFKMKPHSASHLQSTNTVNVASTDLMDIGEDAVGDRKLPSIEDFYMKDTKTKNTNVLATELIEEVITTDSEKFQKLDNVNRPQDTLENAGYLNDLMEYEAVKRASCKPLKETNLLANVKDKFADDCFTKKLFSELESEHEEFGLNNIKRMKIDEEEKNLRMQAKLKVNTDKNPVKEEDPCINLRNLDQGDPQYLPGSSEPAVLSHPHDSQGPQMNLLNNEELMFDKYVRDADEAWQKYLERNRSTIVDTFHGQFKSTVVCSHCYHISMMFEPFMYLSVPLPHAMQRQISVIFVPCDNKQAVRYLVTLNKHDSVKKLKQELCCLTQEESCDVITAEVFENHISRILDDNTLLRFVNDTTRTVFAFEMFPLPQIDDVTADEEDVSMLGSDSTTFPAAPNNLPTTHFPGTNKESDAFAEIGVFSVEDIEKEMEERMRSMQSTCTQSKLTSAMMDEDYQMLNNLTDDGTQAWSGSLQLRTEASWQENQLTPEGLLSHATLDLPLVDETPLSLLTAATRNSPEFETAEGISDCSNGVNGDSEAVEAIDQWRTCVICLEEMLDSDLMVHSSCGGTICQICLEMSFKHSGDTNFNCPSCGLPAQNEMVCLSPVDPADDFMQLNCMADYKPKTRILSVPVVHRYDYAVNGEVKMKLFGHPNILYLPSKLTGEFLYEAVDRLVSVMATYSIVLTDGQGYRCSRCLYTQHCSGCEMSRASTDLALQPGDHVAVRYTDLSEEQMQSASRFVDHESMQHLRSEKPLNLFECFTAFTQSEVLDEQNPWFCPKCKKNQCANKTMTVWRYPETLVVYLKRFVYHELTSTKIDNKVECPLEGLDLSNYISGPKNCNLIYDLQSCVCHFGGASAGHYTSYAKHPLTQDWWYYNDENTTQKTPGEADYSTVYILFYQRQGTKASFHLPPRDIADKSGSDKSCRDQAKSDLTNFNIEASTSDGTTAGHQELT